MVVIVFAGQQLTVQVNYKFLIWTQLGQKNIVSKVSILQRLKVHTRAAPG